MRLNRPVPFFWSEAWANQPQVHPVYGKFAIDCPK
jgi:hypothetical protein